ncbi:MAG: hypothetical protein ACI81F_002721 [Thalassolituus oleivorans]|jgi:hypothetical protein
MIFIRQKSTMAHSVIWANVLACVSRIVEVHSEQKHAVTLDVFEKG